MEEVVSLEDAAAVPLSPDARTVVNELAEDVAEFSIATSKKTERVPHFIDRGQHDELVIRIQRSEDKPALQLSLVELPRR